MLLTTQQLLAIVPGLTTDRAIWVLAGLNTAAEQAGVTTRLRLAAFIAQWAEESAGFQYLKEIWGPTPAQCRYEGRLDLGNTQPGDGRLYCGRGWPMLTGRANYRKYGQKLGLPLEAQPQLVEQPAVAWRVAASYWNDHGLNADADKGDFETITRKINGGLNGYSQRLAYYERALRVISDAQPQTILIDGGGNEVTWNGQAAQYGGVTLCAALISQLRTVYPSPGGPWIYQGLKVYVRRNGDLVLEKTSVLASAA